MSNILAQGACTQALGTTVDGVLPAITSTAVTIVQVVIPVLLIVLGMVDFSKAVITSDEKEQKAAQGRFVKRVVYAIIVFLIVSIVKLIFGVIGSSMAKSTDSTTQKRGNAITGCVDCFVNGTNC